jgi:hypothetical protein
MHFPTWLKSVGVMAVVAYAASPAIAQTGGGTGGQAGQNGAAPAAAVGGGQVARKRLSPEEQTAEADRHITRMEQTSRGVSKQVEGARQKADVVKTLCLNDKLSQVNVAVRSAKDWRQQLGAAIQRKDTEAADHKFTLVTVLRQRTDQLGAEANQCIGSEAVVLGDAKVTTTVDPTIPQDQANYPPGPGGEPVTTITQPPYCTSCTR